jgi:transcription-repair coupling factor (superfamily II helicase)
MARPESPETLAKLSDRILRRSTPLLLTGLRGSARAIAIAELIHAHGARPVLVVSPGSKESDALRDDLCAALGETPGKERLRVFPRHDTHPYDRFSPQPEIVSQRMARLHDWLAAAAPGRRADPVSIVITPWTALATRVPSRDALRARTAYLEVAQTIDRDALIERLTGAGYARMSLVEEAGEFAVRGGILDIFPPQRRYPLRVELLGNEVESIREFDPSSQRSQSKLSRVALPPPREILFDRESIVNSSDDLLAHVTAENQKEMSVLIDSLLRGDPPAGVESIVPWLPMPQETVLDYLPDDTLVILDDNQRGREHLDEWFADAQNDFEAAQEVGRPAASPEELMISPESLCEQLFQKNPVLLERLDIADQETAGETISVRTSSHDELRRELASSRTHERALEPLVDRLVSWRSERWRVVIVCPALSGAERLRTLLAGYDLETRLATHVSPVWRWSAPGRIEVRVASLSEGFVLKAERLAVLTEEEIFGPREKRRRRAQWDAGTALDGIAQLAAGDYLVHAEHGIGTYRGLMEFKSRGLVSELLCVEYLGGDRLFLPVDRLNLVQRYGGADGVKPRIDRLGGQSWQKARERVKKSLRSMAAELLAVHGAREIASGFSFSPRDSYFREFEASFPFEETPDQRSAIEDVLASMQNPRPMDRLVCGDVGYGKTEVAIRAALRAALDGKQVAVLVPTTILCQQHATTFRQRFAGYPVQVEALSRFSTTQQARAVLEGLAAGKVDIVIGTHRLLQKKVVFRDLGLLVVDEEHRFGVGHKERIKQIKKTVDVLTLTATPIPRTLQMAFTGIRDLSVINTPPADRFAIRTQVCRFSESMIQEAILREVRRGGQVFFVNDRVRSIGVLSELLARIVPEVKVLVAHGQMKERELEDRMLAFQNGEADLLLCTTIIESGLDIPRANTILINRAHALGLAQLYQLRGRVGRSHQRAYAYLLVPPEEALSHEAQRRVEAIQDLSELGSGFRLANMDLEIRGAGSLLGAEQSGNLLALGYETYMALLQETIEELRGQIRNIPVDPEIRLPVTARLPEEYIPDVSQRLVLYKRLASSSDEDDLMRIRDEILDRYGVLVPDAENLLEVIRLKILARNLGVASIGLERGELVLAVAPSSRIDPSRLVQILGLSEGAIRVTPEHKIFAPAAPAGSGPEAIFEAARNVMRQLAD